MKWFKHDVDANMDAKLQNLMLDYGMEGYGLYWYCLEIIAANVTPDNINFELEHDARIIARNVGMTPEKVMHIMKYMVNIGLFDISETTENLRCLSLKKRVDNWTQRVISKETKNKHVATTEILPSSYGIDIEVDKNREEEIIIHAKPEKQKLFSFNLTKKSQYDNLSKEYKDKLYAYAVIKDGAYEFQKFIDNHSSKGNTFKDWSRAYNTWISNAIMYSNGKWNPEHHVYKIDNHPEYGTVFKESTGNRIFTSEYEQAGEVTIKVKEQQQTNNEYQGDSQKVMSMISGLGVKI